ncbi:hypothetical protein J3R30DRAFT_3409353 [Lentinula aciculospora]|uniref:Uncharacterized protein n=1 Tax=Lentinula aciculospora TaxID=153920 RepID=A0A9W9DGT7_9AGAR|nr:hypothetical protein J3R30DRAFT_3409353 [Lentinula aciculospora]
MDPQTLFIHSRLFLLPLFLKVVAEYVQSESTLKGQGKMPLWCVLQQGMSGLDKMADGKIYLYHTVIHPGANSTIHKDLVPFGKPDFYSHSHRASFHESELYETVIDHIIAPCEGNDKTTSWKPKRRGGGSGGGDISRNFGLGGLDLGEWSGDKGVGGDLEDTDQPQQESSPLDAPEEPQEGAVLLLVFGATIMLLRE